jgi:hypothetical protein
MSRTTLRRSLSDRVDRMRVEQPTGAASRLPPVALKSALVELLLSEFAASLPGPLAAKVRSTDCPGTALDWLAAAAVHRAVAHDPVFSQKFLELVETDPSAAGQAMATALAAKQEPPPRDAAWHRRDRLGLFLQLAAAALVLAGRFALFAALARVIGFPVMPGDIVRVMSGLGLLDAARVGGLVPSLWLTVALVWAGLEATAVPRALEALRRLPATLRHNPPPLSWRVDAFHVVWYLQAASVFCMTLAALCRSVAASFGPNLALPVWPVLVLFAALLLVALGAEARTAARLGTTWPGQG